MRELLSMGLFWYYIMAGLFTFFMQRTIKNWSGANQILPAIMSVISFICWIATIVLTVFIFIKVKPWWYGLVMLVVDFIVSSFFPVGKTGETILAIIGMIGGPLFIVLSFLKLFAVI